MPCVKVTLCIVRKRDIFLCLFRTFPPLTILKSGCNLHRKNTCGWIPYIYIFWHSVDRASWYIWVIKTNKMHFFLLIYVNNHPLRVSNKLAIHHLEAVYCICSIYGKLHIYHASTRWFKYDRDWFVCKQAAPRSSCATLREWSHNLQPPSCSG